MVCMALGLAMLQSDWDFSEGQRLLWSDDMILGN